MFITFRKWTIYYVLCLVALLVTFALITRQGESVQTAADAFVGESVPILIIDPGHGGEDGGAVAIDGTIESHINLAVSSTVADIARLLGWEVMMTRQEDISIHDDTAQTIREKKVSDLKNRVELCNAVEHGILVSIHQNSMPAAKSVRGAQAFYNENSGSPALAQAIQVVLNQTINVGRPKESKPIGGSSYLMKSVTIPAVLIECGFLSNEADTQLLKTAEYQRKLSVCIVSALTDYLRAGENTAVQQTTNVL